MQCNVVSHFCAIFMQYFCTTYGDKAAAIVVGVEVPGARQVPGNAECNVVSQFLSG